MTEQDIIEKIDNIIRELDAEDLQLVLWFADELQKKEE